MFGHGIRGTTELGLGWTAEGFRANNTTDGTQLGNSGRRNFIGLVLKALIGTSLSGCTADRSLLRKSVTEMDKFLELLNSTTNTITADDSRKTSCVSETSTIGSTILAPFDPNQPMYVKDIPDMLKWAVIAREDPNFDSHGGVDYTSCTRAWVDNQLNDAQAGCSTITMQLIKKLTGTLFNTQELKKEQILLAEAFEKKYSKDQILTAYLNLIDFPENTKGVLAAANKYWGIQSLDELTMTQCAMLSAMLKEPGRRSPFNRDHYQELYNSTGAALEIMKKASKCPQQLRQEAADALNGFTLPPTIKSRGTNPIIKVIRDQFLGSPPDSLQFPSSIDLALQEVLLGAINKLPQEVTVGEIAFVRPNGTLGALAVKGNIDPSEAEFQLGSSVKTFVAASYLDNDPGENNLSTGFPRSLNDQYPNTPVNLGTNDSPKLWPKVRGPQEQISIIEAYGPSYNGPFAQICHQHPEVLETLGDILDKVGIKSRLTDGSVPIANCLGSPSANIFQLLRLNQAVQNEGTAYDSISLERGVEPASKIELFSEDTAVLLMDLIEQPIKDGGTAYIEEINYNVIYGAKTGTANEADSIVLVVFGKAGTIVCACKTRGTSSEDGDMRYISAGKLAPVVIPALMEINQRLDGPCSNQ